MLCEVVRTRPRGTASHFYHEKSDLRVSMSTGLRWSSDRQSSAITWKVMRDLAKDKGPSAPGVISFPESSFTLTSGRKTRALKATISGMRHRCRLRSATGWAKFGCFLCFSKWSLPELSLSERWLSGTKTLGTRLRRELKAA